MVFTSVVNPPSLFWPSGDPITFSITSHLPTLCICLILGTSKTSRVDAMMTDKQIGVVYGRLGFEEMTEDLRRFVFSILMSSCQF